MENTKQIIHENSDNGFGLPYPGLEVKKVTAQNVEGGGQHFKEGVGEYEGKPCAFRVSWKNEGRHALITER